MIAGLKHRFIPRVKRGLKRHTIRAGKRWKVGDRIDLYKDSRQKTMKLIFRAPVTKVDDVHMMFSPRGAVVSINDEILDRSETAKLFEADGFGADDPIGQARAFWYKPKKGKCLVEFTGQIVHWDYERRWKGPIQKRRARKSKCTR